MKKWYRVYDQFGGFLRAFRTWNEANCFRMSRSRPDWAIR